MYLGYFFLTFAFSAISSIAVFFIMRAFHIVDRPKGFPRKIHRKIVPLGGGMAIVTSFFFMVGIALFRDHTLGAVITIRTFYALFTGVCIIMFGGFLDDRYRLRPSRQAIFPLLAALVMVAAGIGPLAITNPFGGVIPLDQSVTFADAILFVTLGDIVVFFWLCTMMFATKLLDGLDGLVTGIVGIGAGIIFFLSRQPQWFQPEVALLSVIFAGACAGFLLWNFYPAKIFLGQGGSLCTGFLLGSLAIISGGKIATTLLVMGIPILDMIRVVARRILRHQSIFLGDREHLHYQILASGFSHRQTVLLLYAISLLFGLTTLFLQSKQKFFALFLLCILMLLLGVRFSNRRTV